MDRTKKLTSAGVGPEAVQQLAGQIRPKGWSSPKGLSMGKKHHMSMKLDRGKDEVLSSKSCESKIMF